MADNTMKDALGGPISIIAVAGNEASKGISSLLIFLTFLSANLAILNFLPIPALLGTSNARLTENEIKAHNMDTQFLYILKTKENINVLLLYLIQISAI